nr:retrovirus-related Pol polyprotein from transposon TNT 1-94 [Tanacetum cinerariifolium]
MCYLGHPKVVKGYMLYRFDNESPKIVTSKNMIFNESVMYKDTLKDFGVCTDKSIEELQIKEGIEGVQKPRYKARFVDCRFTKRAGIDYNEVFSLVVRYTSIRVILALTACKDYKLEQLNVKTTFLHGNVEKSPRQWYMRFDEYMLSNGFKHNSYESCVYYMSYALGEYIYLLLYVDDMLIACKIKAAIRSTKSLLKKEFEMKELAEANKILVDDMLAVDNPDAVDVGYKLRVVLCSKRKLRHNIVAMIKYFSDLSQNKVMIFGDIEAVNSLEIVLSEDKFS